MVLVLTPLFQNTPALGHYPTLKSSDEINTPRLKKLHKVTYRTNFSLIIILEQNCRLLSPPSQAQWQRAGRAFACTTVGLNPRTFFEVPTPSRGL
jgi:hypothetical protein